MGKLGTFLVGVGLCASLGCTPLEDLHADDFVSDAGQTAVDAGAPDTGEPDTVEPDTVEPDTGTAATDTNIPKLDVVPGKGKDAGK